MQFSMQLKSVLFAGTAFAALAAVAPGSAWAQAAANDQATSPAVAPSGAETPSTSATVTDTSEGETIIVTGSRIRRNPNDSPLPLQIITTQELERNGISNPEQLVGFLTTNGTGADNLASNADVVSGQQRGNNGASFANLRSQGSGATLILLNNRRVASHGLQGSAVDVNQIPFAAIDRVEVLKEGASAIYGTDAIGGVINFILRKDYEGIGVQGFVDYAEEGDHTIYRTSGIAGYGDLDEQGFNIMAAVSYSDVPELRGDQRDFVNTFQPDRGLSPDTRGTPFGTIFPLAGTFFPNAASTPFVPGSTTVRASGGINVLDLAGGEGCAAIDDQGPYDAELWATPTAALACAWDTGRAAVIQQPLETFTWLGRGVARLGEHEITLEATGSDATAAKRFSNVQLIPNTTTQNFAHPVGAPGYSLVYGRLIGAFPELAARPQAPIAYRWRCIECGRREIVTDTQTARFTLGLDGPLFENWDYRAGASYAESDSKSTLGSGYYYRGTLGNGAPDPNVPLVPGTANLRGLVGALNSGLVNPFLLPGQTQSAAGLAAIQSASAEGVVLYGGKYTVTQFDGSVSGPIFDLPAGAVQAAFGIDYRKEKYRFNGDEREALNRPVIIAAPFDDANALTGAEREIKAAYAEVLIPILDNLEVTVAGRIDDYGDFGTTENPMVNFKYRPVQSLMFRGNYNTAFRVPAFNQLFNGVTESLYTGSDLADPATCPDARPSAAPGCENLVRTIDILNGGNLNLEPETAEMYSLGVVFEPSPNFSASVDFFSINRENTIQILTLRQLVDNFELFEDRFIRNAAGVLTDIDQRWINVGGSKTEGLEIVVRGGLDALGGRVTAGIDGTYLTKKSEQLIDGGPVEDQRGIFTFSGDLGLKWKHNAFVGYTTDDWNVTFTQIFRNGYENQELPGVANGTVTRPNLVERVDDYVIYNLSVAYTGIEGMRFTAGVKNLFDTDPPFAISYDSFTGGGSSWEPRVADPRGRAFTLLAEFKF
jgi:iron complex outermembrane recepter protein